VIRIGTRGSPLALYQANETRDRLARAHGLAADAFEIVVIRTSGDRIQDRPLAEVGGKGLFTKEIEEALLDGRIDLAVHSMKDMPTVLPAGLGLAAYLPRADVRDALISPKVRTLADLPPGARLGTSSLRRAAQLRRLRPDITIVPFRGNVETRLRKLAAGEADATLLAAAGLDRLGLDHHIAERIAPETLLPAVAQGAIGIEIRSDDGPIRRLVAAIDDPKTALEVATERAFLGRLEGSCRTPIAGLARFAGGRLTFRGEVLSPEGRTAHAIAVDGSPERALVMAEDAAAELLHRAGPGFLAGQA
jgi:hydroxymethylbilane synthase